MRTKSAGLTNNAGTYLHVTTANGYGSTATKIRRFTTTVALTPFLTYADSAANGASITVLETGIYSITYAEDVTSANSHFGLSLNSSELTTDITAISPVGRLMVQPLNTTIHAPRTETITGRFKTGDVIRPHTNGTTTTATTTVMLYMIRIY